MSVSSSKLQLLDLGLTSISKTLVSVGKTPRMAKLVAHCVLHGPFIAVKIKIVQTRGACVNVATSVDMNFIDTFPGGCSIISIANFHFTRNFAACWVWIPS